MQPMQDALPESPATLFVRPAAISVGPAALPTFSGSKGTSQSAAIGTTTAVRRKRPIKLNGRMGWKVLATGAHGAP